MIPKILIFLFIISIIYVAIIKKNDLSIEHMCGIQYPVCDNYCQRAKLEVCLTRKNHLMSDFCAINTTPPKLPDKNNSAIF